MVFQCFPSFVSPHLLSSVTWTWHLSSQLISSFSTPLGRFCFTAENIFLHSSSSWSAAQMPYISWSSFRLVHNFGLTISRTFHTKFRFGILLIKTIRMSNTCLIKELERITTYSERGRESTQNAINIYSFHIMLNYVVVYSCQNIP